MEQEGIKTDFLVKKIERLEQSILKGGLNKTMAIELIQNLKEYNIQSAKVIEDCEIEILFLRYKLDKIQPALDNLAKLLEVLGMTREEIQFCSDESIDYLWVNADKKNVENIHSISCLLRLANEDGIKIENPIQLKEYIEHGN